MNWGYWIGLAISVVIIVLLVVAVGAQFLATYGPRRWR